MLDVSYKFDQTNIKLEQGHFDSLGMGLKRSSPEKLLFSKRGYHTERSMLHRYAGGISIERILSENVFQTADSKVKGALPSGFATLASQSGKEMC